MKNSQKWLISPLSICNCQKINKIFLSTSLCVVMLGIFLLPKTALMAGITPERIYELTNRERAQAGLNELTVDEKLTRAAAAKAEAILASQLFDHTINDRRFSAWVKDAEYKYTVTGENLAIDFISAEGVLKAWMASVDHRQNILTEQYRDIGAAVITGEFEGQKTIVVVQIFGAPVQPELVPPDIARRQERWKGLETISLLNRDKKLLSHNSLKKYYSLSMS